NPDLRKAGAGLRHRIKDRRTNMPRDPVAPAQNAFPFMIARLQALAGYRFKTLEFNTGESLLLPVTSDRPCQRMSRQTLERVRQSRNLEFPSRRKALYRLHPQLTRRQRPCFIERNRADTGKFFYGSPSPKQDAVPCTPGDGG